MVRGKERLTDIDDEQSARSYEDGRRSPILEGITEERVQLQPSPQPLPLAGSLALQHNTASSCLDTASELEKLERAEIAKGWTEVHTCNYCQRVCVRI